MKNRRISPQWIIIFGLILTLAFAACAPTREAPLENPPSPTEDVAAAQAAQNTPTPSSPTDGSGDGTTDGTTDGTGDGTTDGATDGTGDGTTDGSTDGSTTGDGTTDGTTDGTGDGTTDGSTDGTGDGTDTTTPANTPTPTPAPIDNGSGGTPTTHLVQPGDTVYNISVRYGVSVDAIASANNLGPHYTIYVGQTLIIPGDEPTPPIEPPPSGGCSTTHVVQPGENLFRIGLRYGYTVNELAAANPEIVNPNNIKVGQVICIP